MNKRKKKRTKILLESIEVMLPEYVTSACCGDWDMRDYYRKEIDRCIKEIWSMI